MLPKTKFDDIWDDVSRLMRSNEPIDRLALQRVKREASKLRQADPVGAFEVLAQCAALEGNVDEIDRLYTSAIHAPGSWDTYSPVRFADAFSTAGAYEKAKVLLLGLAKENEHSEEIRDLVANYLGRIGYLAEGANVRPSSVVMPKAMQLVLQGEQHAAEISTATQFALDLLRKENVRPSAVVSWIANDVEEHPFSLVLEFAADIDVERASSVEEKLFEALAEACFPLEQSGKLIFAVNPTGPDRMDSANVSIQ